MAIWFLTTVSRLNGFGHRLIKICAKGLFLISLLLPLCLPAHAGSEGEQGSQTSSDSRRVDSESRNSLLRLWNRFFLSNNNSDHVVIRSLNDELTLAQLNQQSLRLGKHLQVRLGIGKRVAVLMPSSPKLLIVLLGILRAGLVPVIIPADGNSEELFHSLGQKLVVSQPSMLISEYEYYGTIRKGIIDAYMRESSAEKRINFHNLPLLLSSKENTDKQSSDHPAWLNWLIAKFSNMMFRNFLNSFDLDTVLHWGEEDFLETGTFQQGETALILFSASTTGQSEIITMTHRNLQSDNNQITEALKSYPGLSVDTPSVWMPVSMTDPFGLAVTLRMLPMLQGTLQIVGNHRNIKELISSLNASKPHAIFSTEGVLSFLSIYKSASTQDARGDRIKFILLDSPILKSGTRDAVRNVFGVDITESYWVAEATVPIALEKNPGEGLSLFLGEGVHIVPAFTEPSQVSLGTPVGPKPLSVTEWGIDISGDSDYWGDAESAKRDLYTELSGKHWVATGDGGLITDDGYLKITGSIREHRYLEAKQATQATQAGIISTVVNQLHTTEQDFDEVIWTSPKSGHVFLGVYSKLGAYPPGSEITAKSAKSSRVVSYTGLNNIQGWGDTQKVFKFVRSNQGERKKVQKAIEEAAISIDSLKERKLSIEEQACTAHNTPSNTK